VLPLQLVLLQPVPPLEQNLNSPASSREGHNRVLKRINQGYVIIFPLFQSTDHH
jgi:hypothetical protein